MNKKEIYNYLIFGVLTTIVNMISFWILEKWVGMDYKFATTIAWVLSVIFAFITNKLYVFNSKITKGFSLFKELIAFIFFRFLSYLLDLITMVVLVEFFLVDSLLAKVVANVFIVVFNYFVSKFVVFKPSR